MIISINGKITDEKRAKIPVTSNAFLFGYAVFETIRTYNKKVFRLNDHIARLYMSADIMGIKPEWTLKKAYAEVCRVLDKSEWKEAKIRVILTNKNFVVMVEPLKEKPTSMYKKGVKIVSFHGKRNVPHAKKLADAFCYLAKQHALSCGAYEALLVDPKTYVRECAYANIFWVKDGKLHSTNKEILFGITRETIIELADGGIVFRGVKYKNILDADEVFITQTTSGILPVVEIDGQKIGTGRPGPVTKKLMKKFEKLVWGK
ncbi:aminotransferase class IV [Patescibacteria group bacterium]|nr:aminotransferase class IV [Patescibacteria group bacterium]MBU1683450.1 aminotransferase class IV [Patescibacteria group bacterium]MBU1934996.1 aminotransferase class IV [Patescibacteria group bacterium]